MVGLKQSEGKSVEQLRSDIDMAGNKERNSPLDCLSQTDQNVDSVTAAVHTRLQIESETGQYPSTNRNRNV